MSNSLKRNLIANYIGDGWSAIMGFAFIPIYIKYLGIESYGIIGIFATLQVWLGLLDMGMSPTLSREIAFLSSDRNLKSIKNVWNLLRTIEIIIIVIALLIAAGFAFLSNTLATSWFKIEHLNVDVVSEAFIIMGVVASIRFVEGIYRSCIIGMQKQVLLSVVNILMSTLRGLGAIGVLKWVSSSITTFFYWQGLVSFLTIIILALATYKILPYSQTKARFSISSLKKVRNFAGGMIGITFFAMLLSQIDKVILSRMLAMTDFGYYSLASVVSGALFLLIVPITQSFYPKFCELLSQENSNLIKAYHRACQLVTIVAGSFSIVLIMYSETFLELWTKDRELAMAVSPLLKVLLFGNLINSVMRVPYIAQLSFGWTKLLLNTNIVAFIVLIPAIIYFTLNYGSLGAAVVWLFLNIGYLTLSANFMYKRIFFSEKWKWYFNDLFLPLATSIIVVGVFKIAIPTPKILLGQILVIGIALVTSILSSTFMSNIIRADLQKFIKEFKLKNSI